MGSIVILMADRMTDGGSVVGQRGCRSGGLRIEGRSFDNMAQLEAQLGVLKIELMALLPLTLLSL